jgi:hypothetical protein
MSGVVTAGWSRPATTSSKTRNEAPVLDLSAATSTFVSRMAFVRVVMVIPKFQIARGIWNSIWDRVSDKKVKIGGKPLFICS